MMDLFLTKNGDLSFSPINKRINTNVFEFNFHVARTDSLLYNFSVINIGSGDRHSNQFDYNFYIYKPEYDKVARTVSGTSYINQAIKLRLNTELGTVRNNESLGSELYKLMHSNIPNNKLQIKLQSIVKQALKDIVPDAVIEIHFLNANYLNYHDGIRIVIINNEDVYYYTI